MTYWYQMLGGFEMKEILIALLSLAVVFTFAACDNGTPEP